MYALISSFKNDKLSKKVRKIKAHGHDRFFGRFEAIDNALVVKSGRVKLRLDAEVLVPGAFSIRDAVWRKFLESLRGEAGVRVVAEPSGLRVNGSLIQFSSSDYIFPCDGTSNAVAQQNKSGL